MRAQDFGKLPRSRQFVQEYMLALSTRNDSVNLLREFVRRYCSLHNARTQLRQRRFSSLSSLLEMAARRVRVLLKAGTGELVSSAPVSIERLSSSLRVPIHMRRFEIREENPAMSGVDEMK